MKNWEELFVTAELAIKLKEKGFNEWCFAVFTPEFKCVSHYGLGEEFTGMWKASESDSLIPTPLFDQVGAWFRKNHKLNIWLDCDPKERWIWTINFMTKGDYIQCDDEDNGLETIWFDEYYKAYNNAIEKALTLI